MTASPALSNGMIIIAVSKYAPPYTHLPGTLTSAKRLANWARSPAIGRNYSVLEITDENNCDVTVERLKIEISGFLASTQLDRLVVYFAGHGLVRSAFDQYWLLTNAGQDTVEGVNLNAFKQGLQRQGIGIAHPTLRRGQLSFIVDACRNTNEQAINFVGHPIITSGGQLNPMQVDLFFASAIGEVAYHVREQGTNLPYCLFSQTLTEALEGNVPAVIETQHHQYSPAILNNLLADYLEVEVPLRAARNNVKMEPDMQPAIRPAHNYYDLLSNSRPLSPSQHEDDDDPNSSGPKRDSSVDSYSTEDRFSSSEFETIPETVEMGPADEELSVRTQWFRGLIEKTEERYLQPGYRQQIGYHTRPIALIEGRPELRLNAGVNATVQYNEYSDITTYVPNSHRDANFPIFVKQPNGDWLLIPLFDYTVSVSLLALPGDVLLHSEYPNEFSKLRNWDISLSATATSTTLAPLRVADASSIARDLRHQKTLKPNNGNLAGYLYDFVGDLDNVRRTAHFMARKSLPFDLALLASERLIWRRNELGNWQVFADLPSVEVDATSNKRPDFTTRSFKEKKQVPVAGILPAFRQGFLMLAATSNHDVPIDIVSIAKSLSGGSAAVIPEESMQIIIRTFRYMDVAIPRVNGGYRI